MHHFAYLPMAIGNVLTVLFYLPVSGDKRIETIEVNLETLDVVQSRGVCNNNTEYHERIIQLVKKNT